MDTNKQLVYMIRDIFTKVRGLPADERAKVLTDLCRENTDLLSEVESLLQVYDSTDGLLLYDASGTVMSDESSLVGTMINDYHLVEHIGEGGFGEVFRAEQTAPMHREVALKIIKLGMDTKNVVARFEAEREALARMNHPGIAQVYDAGITETGRPYFVMELVRGIPFINYCDQHRLSLPERLTLFCDVCEAVQHAHQKGILHRDLKPSNILVCEENEKPLPKIIDFGIAKSLRDPLTEQTLATLQEMLIGTPLYMSPEQLDSDVSDIDTRADIYSLGIILYELVAGTTPLEGELSSPMTIAEMRQALAEKAIPRPSRRFRTLGPKTTTIANERKIKPPSLERLLRGDLDWVVMKAIERERERRYDDVGTLAKDLERYLNHKPVSAGPPSLAYRGRKFIRRHRMASGVVASIAASLLLGAVVSSIGFIRATRAAERARKQEAIAEATYQFFAEELMGQVDPCEQPDRNVKLRTVIDRAASQLDYHFISQPLVCARIHRLLSALYGSLGEYAAALKHAQKAMELVRKEVDDPHHLEILASMDCLVSALYNCERDHECEQLLKQLLILQEETFEPGHEGLQQTKLSLACVYLVQGRTEEAEQMMRDLLTFQKEALGNDDPLTVNTLGHLANLLSQSGQRNESEKLYRDLLDTRRHSLGSEHPSTMASMHGLGSVLLDDGKLQEAESLLREAWESRQRVLGPEHPLTLGTELNLSVLLLRQGKKREAEKILLDLLEARKRVSDAGHPDTTSAAINLAIATRRPGRQQESEEILRKVLVENLDDLAAVKKEVWEPRHTRNLEMLEYAGFLMETWTQEEIVVEAYRQLPEVRLRIFGEDNPDAIRQMHRFSCALRNREKYQEAEEIGRKALELLEVIEWDEGLRCRTLMDCAIVLFKRGEFADAEPYARKSIEVQKRISSYDERHMRDTAAYLAEILGGLEQHEEAVRICREVVDHTRQNFGLNDTQTFNAEHALAKALYKQGSYPEAEELCRLTLLKRQQNLGKFHPHTQKSRRLLVEMLRSLGKADEADELEREIEHLEALKQARQKKLSSEKSE